MSDMIRMRRGDRVRASEFDGMTARWAAVGERLDSIAAEADLPVVGEGGLRSRVPSVVAVAGGVLAFGGLLVAGLLGGAL